MNKSILFAVLVLITFTSCKKDYTCECSVNGGAVWSESYSNVKQAEAESECTAYENYSKLSDPEASCSLK